MHGVHRVDMSGPSRRLKNERPEVEVDVAQPKKKCGEVRCKVCLQPHALRLCTRFRAMDPARRRKAVMQFGYCFNCLAESHKRTDCRSRERCMERRNNASRRVARNPETQQQRTISGRCTCGHNPTSSTTVSPNTGHGPATIVIHVHSGSH
ncbi:uncharacterized protein LOC142221522 isoform X2 [Haematobia irritans]|uniref:uncharacterized protein LOC142221522 isoform X1 n=1 Tax=Haematobia irritans TaxID=7368 RepID=UPI003F505341